MASEWQEHAAPFLRKALKEAARTFAGPRTRTAAQERALKKARSDRDKLNKRIRQLRDAPRTARRRS